jgi:hypothetical protein
MSRNDDFSASEFRLVQLVLGLTRMARRNAKFGAIYCLKGATGLKTPISVNLMRGPLDGRVAFVPEGRCDRSLARSAWDSATQKSRPVGYGLIRAGLRTDSMVGVTKFEYAAHFFDEKYLWVSCARSYRTLRGRFSRWTLSQALRAKLLSLLSLWGEIHSPRRRYD